MTRNARGSDTTQPRPASSTGHAEEAGAAFWRFSLALYARPGVAGALIALQDRAGLDVNLILFGLWIGARRGCELGPEGFAAAASSLAELNGIVRTMRALRRQVGEATDGDIRNLRRALLPLELAAERQVQRRLAGRFAAGFTTGVLPYQPSVRPSAALANLRRSLAGESDSPEAAVLRCALASLTRRA